MKFENDNSPLFETDERLRPPETKKVSKKGVLRSALVCGLGYEGIEN